MLFGGFNFVKYLIIFCVVGKFEVSIFWVIGIFDFVVGENDRFIDNVWFIVWIWVNYVRICDGI